MEKSNRELLEDLGIQVRKLNSSGKSLCPKCSHLRKKKTDPCLSVNVNDGTYNCHNDSCDFKGRVGNKEFIPKQKEYILPKFVNQTELSDAAVKWFFEKRSITQKTLTECRVTQSMEYMPQTQKEANCINFNYFREEELVNVKFRDGAKNFKMVSKAELIFYGLNDIKNSDWCIIVEGEIDKLSFWQAGIKECISVPNGASKSSVANLEYLDNCYSYFDNKKKIIIATDNDEAGIFLRDELSRRLGYHRCFKVDLREFKDSNELLHQKGVEFVISLINDINLIEYPIDGIITGNDVWDNVELLFKNGLQRGDLTGFSKDFDKMVSFVQGQLMVLTGIPNHGKSPFALMIMVCLSLKHKWKWGFYTPEHKPLEIFIIKICELILGKRVRPNVGFTIKEKELVKDFINEHFFFIEPSNDSYTLDSILSTAKDLVLRKGIKGLLIDPWNKLEHNIERGDNETTYISKELDKIIKFNQTSSVLSIIIAHPTKTRKDLKTGLFEVPNMYDIAGSSNWFNKPDIGISFYRNFSSKLNEVYVQKMKYEHLGEQGNCFMSFNMNNGRFNIPDKYDNTNWLIPNAVQYVAEIKELENILVPEINNESNGDLPF